MFWKVKGMTYFLEKSNYEHGLFSWICHKSNISYQKEKKIQIPHSYNQFHNILKLFDFSAQVKQWAIIT